jgi:hypothetical protein
LMPDFQPTSEVTHLSFFLSIKHIFHHKPWFWSSSAEYSAYPSSQDDFL